MTKYEIMFILSTQITDEEKKAVVEKVEKVLGHAGAEEIATEIMGDRKLAYPIKKKENGYYVLTKFTMDGTKLGEVESKLNISESILKYMIVRNEK